MRPAAAATALLQLPAVKQFLKNSISRFQFIGRQDKQVERKEVEDLLGGRPGLHNSHSQSNKIHCKIYNDT